MASREAYPLGGLYEREVRKLYYVGQFGASGAISTSYTGERKAGITSVAKNTTNQFTVTLDEKYPRLLGYSVSYLYSSAEDLKSQLITNNITTGSLVFANTKTSDNTGTDPTSGTVVFIEITVGNL